MTNAMELNEQELDRVAAGLTSTVPVEHDNNTQGASDGQPDWLTQIGQDSWEVMKLMPYAVKATLLGRRGRR